MPDPVATPENHTSCEVRNFIVFAPGYWKGRLYSPAEVARIASNFAYLQAHLTPTVKLGHDREQLLQERLKQSLGFLNLGTVESLRLTPNGCVAVDLVGIPIDVGAAINAGWINSASVELKPSKEDPADASKTVEGPILTAVSLLGEEQPALQDKRLSTPRATFPDGSAVPAATHAGNWLSMMSEVQSQALAADAKATDSFSLCFSDYSSETPTVTPEQIEAAFQALPPDQQAALLPRLSPAPGPTPETTPPAKAEMAAVPPPVQPGATTMSDEKKPDGGAAPPAYFTAFSEKMDRCFADMGGRIGAVEKFAADAGKKGEEAEMSAFSAEWDATFKAGDGERKIEPAKMAALKKTDLDLAATAAFSTADTRGGLISGLATRLADLPVNPRIDPSQGKPVMGPDGKPLPKPKSPPTETLNMLLGEGSLLGGLAGDAGLRKMRDRLNVA